MSSYPQDWDEWDDRYCADCDKLLPEEIDPDSDAWHGFCSRECRVNNALTTWASTFPLDEVPNYIKDLIYTEELHD